AVHVLPIAVHLEQRGRWGAHDYVLRDRRRGTHVEPPHRDGDGDDVVGVAAAVASRSAGGSTYASTASSGLGTRVRSSASTSRGAVRIFRPENVPRNRRS